MSKLDPKVLDEILSGKYKDCYVIYIRKSTDEDNLQKNSISFQGRETDFFAKKNELNIAPVTLSGFCKDGVIAEKHSAFKTNDEFEVDEQGRVSLRIKRPKFSQLLHYLTKKCFKGVILYSLDRGSRNDYDEAFMKQLFRTGVDIRYVTTTYEKSSSGSLHMDVDGMFSKHHSRLTSEKVTKTTRHLREQGICTYKAPIGYLNLGDPRKKPFDLKRSPLIMEMFEKYSTGDWTLSALARWANDNGLTMPPVRKRRTEEELLADDSDTEHLNDAFERPLTYNSVHKILSNRFYLGYIKGTSEQEWILSQSHEPLVSSELFEKVQSKLRKKKVSKHYQNFLGHPYRKFVRCKCCNRVYTPYEQKGVLYFGPKCQEDCPNTKTSFNREFIEVGVSQLISELYFSKEELEEFDRRIKADVQILEERRLSNIKQIDRKKRKIREDLKFLRENKLTLLKEGAYTSKDYLAEEFKLNSELDKLKQDEHISDEAMNETMKEVISLSELLQNLALYYEFATGEEKEKIARIIFSELYVDENTLNFKLTPGMKPFEKRLNAICDPTGNRTRISRMKT